MYSYWASVVLGEKYSASPHTRKQYLSTFVVSSSSIEQATLRITCSTLQLTVGSIVYTQTKFIYHILYALHLRPLILLFIKCELNYSIIITVASECYRRDVIVAIFDLRMHD